MSHHFTHDLALEALVPSQPPCICGACEPEPCSESPWQSTGPCLNEGCTHYGTEVDGGLCEGCYIETK